jgi:predicted transcriptional regulator
VLKKKPAKVIKRYKETLPRVIPENLWAIDIECVEHLMHKQVFKLLITNEYKKLGDLTDLSIEKFMQFKNSGKIKAERYADFLVVALEKPDLIIHAYQESLSKIIPSEFHVDDFFNGFSLFINECYELRIRNAVSSKQKGIIERSKRIVQNHFAVADNNGKAQSCLEISNLLNDLSVERVRQLLNIEIDYFRKLFAEGENSDSHIIISEALLSFYTDLKECLFSKVYAEDLLYKIVRDKFFNLNSDSNQHGYLMFMLRILGFHLERSCHALLGHESVFLKLSKLRDPLKKRYFNLSAQVFRFLNNYVLSIDINSLFVEISKMVDCSLDEILLVCENSSFIDNLSVNDAYFFQMKFSRLSSFEKMAYRVLKEGEEKPISRYKLARKINERLVETDRQVTADNLVAQLVSHERFKCQGRVSWALKEWDVNVDKIKDVLAKCFRIEKKPLSIIEIHDIVLNVFKRDNISIETVRQYMYRPHFFSITNDGERKYISKEYANVYSAFSIRRNSNKLNWRLVLDILNKYPDLSLSNLLTHCQRANINISMNMLSKYLPNKDWVKISYDGLRKYSVVSNYIELFEAEEQAKPVNKIKFSILEKLDRNDKKPLSDIIKFCELKHNMTKTYAYKLVGRMEDDMEIIKDVIDRKTYVRKY